MAGLVQSLFIKLTADTSKFNTGMNRAGRQLTATQKKFAAASKAARGFGVALGGVVSAGTFMRFSRDAIQMGSRLDDTAKKLGLTTDMLQEFGFAAREVGIKTTAAEMGLQRFARRLAEAQVGTGELLPTLKQYNIALTNTDGTQRSAETVLRDYADALMSARTPQEQLRMAFKAFDSEGAALVSVLRNGAEGLDDWADAARQAGQIMSQETITRLANAENMIEQMNIRLTIWTGNILSMVSAIGDLSRAMPNLPGAGIFSRFGGLGIDSTEIPEIPEGDTPGEAQKDSALVYNDRYLVLKKLTATEAEYKKHLKDRVEIFNRLAAEEFKQSGITDKYIELLENAAKTQKEMLEIQTPLQEAMSGFADTIEDGLVNAAAEGKTAFADMARYIMAQIQRMMIRMVLFKTFTGIGGAIGGNFGSLLSDFGGNFSGGRAAGGPVSAGRTYMVGERGPELVTMGANGYVTPNNQLGGGPTMYVDARGADVAAVMRLEKIVKEMNGTFERRAVNAMQSHYGRNPGALMRA